MTPSTSIATLSPLLFSANNAFDRGVYSSPLVPGYPNTAISPGDREVLDPWRSPSTGQTTTEIDLLRQRGRGVFSWGDEKQNEPTSPAMQTPPPPLSPTQNHPQDGDAPDLSTLLPPSTSSVQLPVMAPSRSLDQRRPALTPSKPSSPHNQQSPSISRQSNKHPDRTRSKKDQHQAHPLSQELPALPLPWRGDIWVSHPTPSIQPIPGRLPDEGGLDPRLAAITPKDSKLTLSRTFRPNDIFSTDSELSLQNSVAWYPNSKRTNGISERGHISGSSTQRSRYGCW